MHHLSQVARLLPLAVGAVVFGCGASSPISQPIPEILKGATAGGGWGSACPPSSDAERKFMGTQAHLAISPELDKRLHDRYPTGTKGTSLEADVMAAGFERATPCKADRSISVLTYYRKGVGVLPYSTSATIYWKSDADGAIVWTVGMVHYSGL